MASHIPATLLGKLSKVSICLVAIASLDCAPLTSNIVIEPSECYQYRHSAIEVQTHDGRLIRFAANTYSVVERVNAVDIEGKGKIYRQNGLYVGRPFEGKISSDEIELIAVVSRWDPGRFAVMLALLSLVIPLAYYGL